MRNARLGAVLAFAFLSAIVAPSPVLAQSYVRADCARLIARARTVPTSLTGRWYKRFWTGDCGGLGGCISGSPNWNQVVGQLVARSQPRDRPAVLAKACRLGPLIGLEWTRPRDVRRIDSGELRAFRSTLESSSNVLDGLNRVDAEVRGKIAG
jgi:hypothetical protein